MQTYEVKIKTRRGEIKMEVPLGVNIRENPNGSGISFEFPYDFFRDADGADWQVKSMKIRNLLDCSAKLPAILAFREMFPWIGLRQGKEAIEAILRGMEGNKNEF